MRLLKHFAGFLFLAGFAHAGVMSVAAYPVRHPVKVVKVLSYPLRHPVKTVK